MTALDTAVVELVEAPAGDVVPVGSAALVDAVDLAAEVTPPTPLPDVYVLVGVSETETIRWLDGVADRNARQRPAAVMTKVAESGGVRVAARRAGVALAAVHPKARWDHVFGLVLHILSRAQRSTGSPADDAGLLRADTDLFDLAQAVAVNAGGMVSIEDAQSKVLAYSASDDSADELRMLSILGREGPHEYLRVLQKWGVFDRIRETGDVVDVPAHDELGIRRRLVVGIRAQRAPSSARGLLGSIWLQQGATTLHPDAAEVLRGASAVAARLISRAIHAPTTEGVLVQRLFGAYGGGVDIPTVAAALDIDSHGPSAVVGFALQHGDAGGEGDLAALGSLLRLHASSFRHDAVTTIIGGRAYVLFPQYRTPHGVATWARQFVDQLEKKRSLVVRAAIVSPLADLARVAVARAEVDRVLDATAITFPEDRVSTLAESLTRVLLGEILELIGRHPELTDPRLQALEDYDSDHGAWLRASVHAYLQAHGDVRQAAAAVNVHPNTLRYRLRRVEELLGISLADQADRLLLELQLAVAERHPPA
ncbi:MAG: helix-turn-helix domain-containing protein [Mycobacterium sp.]